MIPIRDENASRTLPFITWTLIAVNIVIFLHEVMLPAESLVALVDAHALVPRRFWSALGSGDWSATQAGVLTLVSSMFLHGSWLHLLGNVWSLWLFGDNIEDRLGHVRYLLFYLLCGLAAGILHAVLHGRSQIPTLGASGAIAGVMGAYLLLFPLARITVLIPVFIFPLFVKLPAFVYLAIWIALQALGGYAMLSRGDAGMSGIAFWAHIGGFGAGILLIRRWKQRFPRRSFRRV